MGYSIRVGHVELRRPDPDDLDGQPYLWVPTVMQPDAPDFPGDPTGPTNDRVPSYQGWDHFCKEADLMDLIYGRDGLMVEGASGGVTKLLPTHLTRLQQARARWEAAHPGLQPGWFGEAAMDSYHYARLLWLEWWVNWALTHGEGAALQYG